MNSFYYNANRDYETKFYLTWSLILVAGVKLPINQCHASSIFGRVDLPRPFASLLLLFNVSDLRCLLM